MADPFTPKFVDLVKNVTTTTGTGDFTLGAAVNGFKSFTSALQVGDRFYYSCLGTDKPAEREVGRGTLLSGGKIAREPIGGAAKTNFTTGNKAIALIAAAEWFDGVAGSVAGATSAAAAANAAAASATSALAGVQSDIGTLEIQVASLDSELDGTVQDLAALEATVAGLESGGGGGGSNSVATRAALAAIAPTDGLVRVLTEDGRYGEFEFELGDHSAEVAADSGQGQYVAPASDTTGASGAWVRRRRNGAMPEDFGAKGDGVTNDSAAFASLTAFITLLGGGLIDFREGAEYVVGAQTLVADAFQPTYQHILDLNGLTKPVVIRGNGATIKTAAGLKYGVFNPDGTAMSTSNGYTGPGGSTPFYSMIRVTGCSGGVHIENVTLDGNSANIQLGGRYGDNDWQIPGSGISIGHWEGTQNSCEVTLLNVASKNQCLDGLVRFAPGEAADDPTYRLTMINCAFEGNSRQGYSWVGGKGTTAINCKFNSTGKGAWASAPKAGMDIEPEGSSLCENGEFINCEFVNNTGPGVQGYGTPSFHHFTGCKFVGTTGPSITEFGPYWSFDDCQITGQMVNVHNSALGPEATKFHRCRFLFGTGRSPTGLVYAPAGHMADFGGSGAQNVQMTQCLLDAEDNAAVQLSYLSGISFEDCELKQPAGSAAGVAQGCTWIGKNTITAAAGVDLDGLINRGQLTNNGSVAGETISSDLLVTGGLTVDEGLLVGSVQARGGFVNDGGPQVQLSFNVGEDQGYIHATNPGVAGKPLKIACTALTIDAPVAVTGDLTVADDPYGAGWNGSLEVPTKNAVYDKIESLGGGGTGAWGSITGTLSAQVDLQAELDAKADLAGGNAFTGLQTVTGLIDTTGGLRATGQVLAASGAGIEVAYAGAEGAISAYDRGGGGWRPLVLGGSTTALKNEGAVKLATTADGIAVTGLLTATGAVTGSNLSGTNTGDETSATIAAKSSGQALTPASLAATGAITSSGGKIGYATGNGGTIAQSPNKSSGVTLNKLCGEITMSSGALAANTAVTFTLTNSTIEAGDRIVVNHKSGGTFGAYVCDARAAAGSASVMLRNITAGSLSEAVVLGFAVIKAVTA